MKPLFKNTTIYNSKNYNQFINFHNKKFAFSYNCYNIFMFILLSYCILLNIIEKNLLLVLLFVVLLFFLLLIRIYIPLKKHEKTKKYIQITRKTVSHFRFINFILQYNLKPFIISNYIEFMKQKIIFTYI